jgi:DNA-binding transcriptional ArsR family regulator
MHGLYDDIFRAMADPHRRQIMAALCEQPRVASDLARLVQLAPNAVSFHLKWLKSAGLVVVDRQGKYQRYQVVASALARWREHLGVMFPARDAQIAMAQLVGVDSSMPIRLPGVVPASPPPRLRIARQKPRQIPNQHIIVAEDESLPTELL